jgi:hypothetical protein
MKEVLQTEEDNVAENWWKKLREYLRLAEQADRASYLSRTAKHHT